MENIGDELPTKSPIELKNISIISEACHMSHVGFPEDDSRDIR